MYVDSSRSKICLFLEEKKWVRTKCMILSLKFVEHQYVREILVHFKLKLQTEESFVSENFFVQIFSFLFRRRSLLLCYKFETLTETAKLNLLYVECIMFSLNKKRCALQVICPHVLSFMQRSFKCYFSSLT